MSGKVPFAELGINIFSAILTILPPQYIVSSQCQPVLRAILKHGVTQSLLRYLLAAIR